MNFDHVIEKTELTETEKENVIDWLSPKKFSTPKKLHAKISEYFLNTPVDEWTVTGLILIIGCKQTFYNYAKKEGYKEIITAARLMVEHSWELCLRKKGGCAPIFALKQFGWIDKSETSQTIEVKKLPRIELNGSPHVLEVGSEPILDKVDEC